MPDRPESPMATVDRPSPLEMAPTRDFDPCPADRKIEGRRVLLIYPPVRLSAKPLYPPFGLISIAAVLEKAGVEVEILDLNLLRLNFAELRREIAKREFDVVGIGGMTTVYYYMKFLSLHLKRQYPHTPLFGGGSACSASPKIVLENTGFDVACVGEGEPIIVELVEKLVAGVDLSTIAGIWHKDVHGRIHENSKRPRMANIADLPYPAYHLIDMEPYIENSHVHKHKVDALVQRRIDELGIDPEKARRPVMLFTKRGCPFACDFCYRNFGRRVVQSSIGHTLEHMSFLEDRYNTACFVFGDEIFNIDKKWVHEFCDRIIAEDRRYILATTNALRANLLDRELLEKMKHAGFCSIGIGIESFYDPTLKAMRKGQRAAQIHSALRLAREQGLLINSTQLLFGYETDGLESMDVNIKALDELGFSGASFSIPCPYPGTELYRIAVERGLITDEEGWLMELADKDISDRVINLSKMSSAELMRIVAYGRDQVRINGWCRQHAVLGRAAALVQRAGRRLGIDASDILSRGVSAFKAKRRHSALQSGGEGIRDEVFTLLEEWTAARGVPTRATAASR